MLAFPEEVWRLLRSFFIRMMYKLRFSDLISLALQQHQEMFSSSWVTAQETEKSRGGLSRREIPAKP